MGVVYKTKQISIDRVIALKMLNQEMAADPNWVQRFYNEAKACSRLQHPNTIRMFDFGQTSEGRLFMTMEFLDGISLRQAVSQGPMTPQRVVKILIQCCASLAEAHSIGIIHRDIKPDNVFLLNMAGSPDFVKLLDFSVAKLLQEGGDKMHTQAGVVFGTPQYMSPEQGRGLPLDARSDLYALGILAYEMLTSMVPFHDENPMTVIQMHLRAEVPPMPQTVPYSVQQIVRRALEKDAARRYQSSGEMMQHCQQVFAELNGGQGSIGAGGIPKTVVAGMAPNIGQMQGGMQPGGMPMQQQPMQQPMQPQGGPPSAQQSGGNYVQASPQQKTMIAQVSPFAQGGFQPGGSPAMQAQASSGLQPQGVVPSSPMQKTIVAGMSPQMPSLQQAMAMTGMSPGGYPQQQQPQQPPHGGPGPNKTVMLAPTDGIVSVARQQPPVQQGASTTFWVVSLLTGIAIGALAYVIVLQL
jgi:serine/threonine-protein kinase